MPIYSNVFPVFPSDVINAFQISHANKSFHVFGQSAADKANWIANLQKHISRVAKTSKLAPLCVSS